MDVVPLFRAAALRPLLDYLARADRSAPQLFGRRLATFQDTGALLPLAAGGAAYELAARELDAPDLGIRVAESTQIERIGELGARIRSSVTLGEALATTVRHGSRFNTGQRFWLVARGDDVWLHRAFARGLVRGRQQVSDLVATFALNVVRLAAGASWRPTELHFEGPPPAHAERLAALATHCVHFDRPTAAIAIPRRLLALPFPDLRGRRERSSSQALPSVEIHESLRQTVEALVRMGEVEAAAVAEAAGTSVRSLQRHLRRHGLRFAELVQEVRCRAAMRMLAERGRKVVEVSAALGYTDSANFTRAFRRWTGVSPLAFRRAASELPVRVTPITPAAAPPASLPIV